TTLASAAERARQGDCSRVVRGSTVRDGDRGTAGKLGGGVRPPPARESPTEADGDDVGVSGVGGAGGAGAARGRGPAGTGRRGGRARSGRRVGPRGVAADRTRHWVRSLGRRPWARRGRIRSRDRDRRE